MPSMFDSPAYPGAPFIHAQSNSQSEKIAAWNAAQIFHPNGQMGQQPRAMFTPPASGSPSHSSHGSPHGSVSPPHSSGSPVSVHSGLAFNEAELYRAHDEQTNVTPAISSVRNRSGSMNINMGTVHSPAIGSPGGSPTYDITNPGEYTFNIPRRAMHNNVWGRDNDIGMSALSVGMNLGVGVGMSPVAVGGGNGTGFAMMM